MRSNIKWKTRGYWCLAVSVAFIIIGCIPHLSDLRLPESHASRGFINLAIILAILGILLIRSAKKAPSPEASSQKASYYVIEEGRSRYTLIMRDGAFELSVPKGDIGPGVSVIHTLTDSEVAEYRRHGISSLKDRISDMNSNMTEYTIQSWR